MIVKAKKIKELVDEYHQKSSTMLFPLLGISRGSRPKHLETYIALDDSIEPEDMLLIVEWSVLEMNDKFLQKIMDNVHYHSSFQQGDSVYIVFDMESWVSDWQYFMQAKYSRMSDSAKLKILNYYSGAYEYPWIESYLYPENYQVQYGRILDVKLQTLKIVGQLCNPPDIEKETLKLKL